MNLKKYGATDEIIEEGKKSSFFLARIVKQSRYIYTLISESDIEYLGEVSGKFIFEAGKKDDHPAVGDWVLVDRESDSTGKAIIHRVLNRKSALKRVSAGDRPDIQLIATNIDYVFITMALNSDFNLRRLERYITVAWDSGAKPVILLTKSDLCENIEEKLSLVNEIAFGIDVIVSSSLTANGYDELSKYLTEGETVVFIGSSGIGKSTLVNYFLKDHRLETKDLRDDDKGKHTTTFRELFLLPNGCIVIDTPGMREVKVDAEDFNSTFEDIESLGAKCKFSDCTHKSEPGCEIKKAIEDGVLSKERFNSYLKLQREMLFQQKKLERKNR